MKLHKSYVSFIHSFMGQISRYRYVLIWFVRDITSKFKYQLSLIAVSSVIGSAGYVSAFGVGYLYIKSVDGGEVPDHISLTRFFETPDQLLLVLAPGIGLLVIFAALIEYWGSREANKVAGCYVDYCVQRVVRLASGDGSQHQLARYGSKVKAELLSLVMKESRLCGITARLLSRGLVNLSGLPVVFFVLVWLSPELTFLTIIFGLLGIVGYYWLSLRGATYRKLVDHLGRDVRKEKLNLISRVLYGVAEVKEKDSQVDAAFERGANHDYREAFAGQRNALEASNLLSKILIAMILTLVLILANKQVMSGQLDWGQMLVYIGVLQMFAVRLVGAARVVVSINRFYPSIGRYWGFVDSFTEIAKNGEKLSNKNLDIEVALGKDQSRFLNKRLVGILMALPVGKDDVSQFINLIYPTKFSDWNLVVRLLNPVQADINASLDDYFGICTIQDNRLADELRAWGIGEKRIAYLLRNRSETFNRNILSKLSEYEVLSFSLIEAKHNDVDLVVISHELIKHCDEAHRQLVLNKLQVMFCRTLIAFGEPNLSVADWVKQAFHFKNGALEGLFDIYYMIDQGWSAAGKGEDELIDMIIDEND